jgi:nucleotide-binding universal stress UspA family protein
MFKRILVPLDGSPLAEQALPFATALAGRLHAGLVLVSTITDADHFGDSEAARDAVEIGRAAATEYLARQQSALADRGFRVETQLAAGRPHIEIVSAADKQRADVIVMTTHARSGAARWALGSVADKVLRIAGTPVILIRPTLDGPPIDSVERIVVPLDGSDLAERALKPAEELAGALGCEIRVVRAVLPPMAFYAAEYLPGPTTLIDKLEAEATDYVNEKVARLRKTGLSASGAMKIEIPARFILEEASQPGDLVVMSTHGRSGIDRWLRGSVADAVVRHGDIPVLVVPSWVTPEDSTTGDETNANPVLA